MKIEKFIEFIISISKISLSIETFSIVYNVIHVVYIQEVDFVRENELT